METEDRDAKIASFKSFFNVDEQIAVAHLEAAHWNAELARSIFASNLQGKICEDPQTDPSKILKYKMYGFLLPYDNF